MTAFPKTGKDPVYGDRNLAGPALAYYRTELKSRLATELEESKAPVWTALFGTVAAIITDGGSIDAHASLIAREYGIPAVVGTGDATARLRQGMIVTVDGTQGVVSISQ